jgi:hypothetical protein
MVTACPASRVSAAERFQLNSLWSAKHAALLLAGV